MAKRLPSSLARYIARSAQRIRSLRIGGVVGQDRDADADADLGSHRVEHERLLDAGRQPARDRRRVVDVGVEQRHHELVAAQPDDQVRVAQRVLEARAELPQELVAGRMAERVVDLLEAVEVEEHEGQTACRRLAVACSASELVEQMEQGPAVAQAGELVGDRTRAGAAR